ncbi:MAG: long-chain fatty acid--CoA ligase [bacterium]|nr:long-chain fatty acid--CoA ligase [bacterium]
METGIPLYERINSVGEILQQGIRIQKEKIAVIFDGTNYSYHQIEILSNQIANFLVNAGVKKQDRIALCCINSPFFVASYIGILKTGATVVAINYLQSPEEIKFVLADSGAKGLIYSDIFEEILKPIITSDESIKIKLVIGKSTNINVHSLAEITSKMSVVFEPIKIDQKQDLAAILYTSGTTGKPKGVMLTHRNLLFDVDAIIKFVPVSDNDTFISVLPMFHAFGATACMLTPLAIGASLVAVPKFNPEQIINIIKETKATVFLGVPSMYVLLIRASEKINWDFSSLRFCISGGAALPIKVLEEFEKKFNVRIYEGDGPTECSPVTSVNPVGGKRKPGSIGLPLPGIEMKIVNEEGIQLKHGEIGEIVVRGENVMKGYLNQPEETRASFFQDWFRTGDLGYQDEEGYFYIVDRKKDLIIVNGLNVYPKMIEDVLMKHPAIEEAAVVRHPHHLHGEIPRAFIVLKQGQKLTKQDILKICRKHLARYEIPKIIEFVEELPKTSTGKIDKNLLMRM